jgi:hypothetical protein
MVRKLAEKSAYMERSLLNARVKKAIDYGRHYRPDVRCPVEPGDIILVEPEAAFGAYQIRTDQMPSVVTYQKLSLLAPNFSQSLGPLAASPGNITTMMTQLDLNIGEIGLYKIVPEDWGYVLQFNQPTAIVRFTSKLGAWNMAGADLHPQNKVEYPALIPELAVFEDRTPITIKAISTDPNNLNNFYVRVGVYGYQLPIRKMPKESTISRGDPRIVMNVWVGNPYK